MVVYMQPQHSGGQGFKVLLSYIASVRLPLVTQDSVSKENERIYIFQRSFALSSFWKCLNVFYYMEMWTFPHTN